MYGLKGRTLHKNQRFRSLIDAHLEKVEQSTFAVANGVFYGWSAVEAGTFAAPSAPRLAVEISSACRREASCQ